MGCPVIKPSPQKKCYRPCASDIRSSPTKSRVIGVIREFEPPVKIPAITEKANSAPSMLAYKGYDMVRAPDMPRQHICIINESSLSVMKLIAKMNCPDVLHIL
ncbi:hypothetical protein DPMN_132639 [Dreissena polymorpha]|uniref:Uncharacterized protein n=1 Tax=Dreissena polymorpha TaxID=45954 RepID=A0A9D4FSV4_DREPO|nr:hypothetical protein DPMN_132639 [Dreissena polymorpha]